MKSSTTTITNPQPSPPTAMQKFFGMPEMVERIALHLDPTSHASASRVNRDWYRVWLPILWHTIDSGHHWRHSSFLDALGKHGDLIRNLQCSRYDDIRVLLASYSKQQRTSFSGGQCRNLVTLVMPKTTLGNAEAHAEMIRQNPGLRDLSLTLHDALSSEFSILVEAIGSLPLIRRLAFDENKSLEVSTLEQILTQCNKSLKELSFQGTFFLKHPFGSGEAFASKVRAVSNENAQSSHDTLSQDEPAEEKESFGITTLNMDCVSCKQDLFLNLTSRFPHLTHLSIRESAEVYFGMDFPQRLRARCPEIKWLDISETEDMDDGAIANLVSQFPRLHTFLAADTRFGTKALDALLDHCPDLTVLNMNSAYGIQGGAIQKLLANSWALRTLDAWDVTVSVVDMMVEAERAFRQRPSATSLMASGVQRTWACGGLESIVLSLDYDQGQLSNLERQAYPLAKARAFVYENLARLTKLRYLAISAALYDAEDDGDDENEDGENEKIGYEEPMVWIDYSIESGLETLGSLKDLRTLCLTGVDHGIELREIQWMCQAWPNLKRIEGLYLEEETDEDEGGHDEGVEKEEESKTSGMGVLAWLRANRPEIEIGDDD